VFNGLSSQEGQLVPTDCGRVRRMAKETPRYIITNLVSNSIRPKYSAESITKRILTEIINIGKMMLIMTVIIVLFS